MSFRQFLANEGRRNRHDYSSILVELPEDLTDNIISWGFDYVPSEHLLSDPKNPTFGREDDIHITVLYGVHTDDVRDVSGLFKKEKEFECTLGKIGLFTKNSYFDVLVVSVDSEDLHRLNRKMRKEIEATESHPVFVPHVTIGYLKKGHGQQYIGDTTFDGENFKIDKLIFSSAGGCKFPIPLGAA
jgi:2'-5' RNA ligase